MADPYAHPTQQGTRPPALTVMTVIAALFGVFVVFQVAATIDGSNQVVEEITVHEDDTIRYDDVARFADDGSVFSTTLRDVAVRANRTTGYPIVPAEIEPKTQKLDAKNFTWGQAAVDALEGAFPGETVVFEIAPEAGPFALVPFDDGQGIPRVFFEFPVRPAMTLTQGETTPEGETFDIDTFLAEQSRLLGRPIGDGERLNIGYDLVPYHIVFDIDRDAGTIQIRSDIQDGAAYPFTGTPAEITTLLSSDGSTVSFRLDLEAGDTFALKSGDDALQQLRGTWMNIHRQDIWRMGSYRVTEVTGDRIFLEHTPDTDAENIGRTLSVEITIIAKGADTQ